MLTDHKAFISALYENYFNNSYQSRLARWADRLLPFDFEVIRVPEATLGIVDYLSRYPTFPAPEPSRYDELFVVKSIEAFHQALTFFNSYNSSNWTRERATKTRFVAAQNTTRKDGHFQLLEAMRRCRLSKPGKINTASRIGVLAVIGDKLLLPSSKKEFMGLPGLF